MARPVHGCRRLAAVLFFLGACKGSENAPSGADASSADDAAVRKYDPASRDWNPGLGCSRSRGGRLPSGCVPEFGEDAWGGISIVTMMMQMAAREVDDCFASIGETGTSAFIPPLSAKCRHAPNRECVLVTPETAKGRPWEYQLPSREESPEWHALGVEAIFKTVQDYHTTQTHHIRFAWAGGENCSFEVEAIADADNDGFWSSKISRYFQRPGTQLEYAGTELNKENPHGRTIGERSDRPPDALLKYQPHWETE